jgi:hypothetical protein
LEALMLEFDDIQYILLTRVPALTGRYEFLSFQQPAQGRAWLDAIREKVPSAKAVADTVNLEKRWVSVALTWNGLRALGVDEASLATFPEEFRQGMAARWQVLGDAGFGPEALVGRSFTRLPFCLLATLLKESGAFASIRHYWRVRPAWRCCRRWTWRRYRSDM